MEFTDLKMLKFIPMARINCFLFLNFQSRTGTGLHLKILSRKATPQINCKKMLKYPQWILYKISMDKTELIKFNLRIFLKLDSTKTSSLKQPGRLQPTKYWKSVKTRLMKTLFNANKKMSQTIFSSKGLHFQKNSLKRVLLWRMGMKPQITYTIWLEISMNLKLPWLFS